LPYVATRAIPLRCTDYSETSQVVALITPDMGQIHALAKGSRRAGKKVKTTPWQRLEHYDCVLSMRTKGNLHLLTEWKMRECFPIVHHDLPCQWTGYMATEIVLSCTSENVEDGKTYNCLLALLRRMQRGMDCDMARFVFLSRALRIIGCAPVTDHCVQCNGPLHGLTRFSPAGGGGLCGDCAHSDPQGTAISRGTLAILTRLGTQAGPPPSLRLTRGQRDEIQRAFNEQIQYHLGRPLRCGRFLSVFMD
jgi:DNA repair protein RecO (recombination protein O)